MQNRIAEALAILKPAQQYLVYAHGRAKGHEHDECYSTELLPHTWKRALYDSGSRDAASHFWDLGMRLETRGTFQNLYRRYGPRQHSRLEAKIESARHFTA